MARCNTAQMNSNHTFSHIPAQFGDISHPRLREAVADWDDSEYALVKLVPVTAREELGQLVYSAKRKQGVMTMGGGAGADCFIAYSDTLEGVVIDVRAARCRAI